MKKFTLLAAALCVLGSCSKDKKDDIELGVPEISLETAIPNVLNFGDSLALDVHFKDAKEMHYGRAFLIAQPQNDTIFVSRKHAHSTEIHLHEKVLIGKPSFENSQELSLILWAENGDKKETTLTRNFRVAKDLNKPNLSIIAPQTKELAATDILHLVFEDQVEMHNATVSLAKKGEQAVLWTKKVHAHAKTIEIKEQLALDFSSFAQGQELELRIVSDNSRHAELIKRIGLTVKK